MLTVLAARMDGQIQRTIEILPRSGPLTPEERITSLLIAARQNDVQAVKALLEGGVDSNAVDQGSMSTPLAVAAIWSSLDVLKLLLAAGANANAKAGGKTALTSAIEYSPDTRSGDPRAQQAQLAAVKALIAAGADVNAMDDRAGLTALTWAVVHDRIDIATALIDAGAKVNALNTHGVGIWDARQKDASSTALMHAAYAGYAGMARMLRARGADPDVKDKNGKTALQHALENGRVEMEYALKPSGEKN
jgi:ankyrin repeat protein